jgi:DNA-binding NarL/FixJ family response regulator
LAPAATTPNRRARLFYAEDSAALRERVLRELARIEAIEVTGWSERADDAVNQIQRIRPDIVVLDLHLSGGSGMDVLREFARRPSAPAIIVLTNHSDPVSRERALHAGAAYFFDKSTEFEGFMAILRIVASRPT